MLCQSNWYALRIAVRRALRCAAHCDTPYVHGQLWEKNDWQFSNPRIDTAYRTYRMSLTTFVQSIIHTNTCRPT